MAKNVRKLLAMVLVMCMLVSALPLQALAAEGDGVVTEGPVVETTDNGLTITTTTTTTTTTTEESKTVVVETEKVTNGTTTDGVTVTGKETTTDTTITESDGTVTEQEVVNGSETKEWTETETQVGDPAPSVEVQLKPGETTGPVHGSLTYDKVVDHVEGSSTETNSDKTTTTTTVERDVTGTMSEVGVTVNKVDTSLVATAPEDYEGKHYAVDGKDIGMISGLTPDYFEGAFEAGQLAEPEKPTDVDGYDFQWTGYGEGTNAARAESMDIVYAKDPVTGEPLKDADGNYIIESLTYTGKYNDGMGSTPAIFALSKTNEDGTVEYFYGYCIDNDTEAMPGHWYKISNLEDSDYYPEDESAAKLRAVALNGYWGTEEGDGSLALIKEKLADYYDEDDTVTIKDKNGNDMTITISEVIDGLTEHEALTATQAAIWSNSNGTLATQDGQDGTIITGIYSVDKPKSNLANTDRDYDYNSDARLQAVYEWLMALDGVEAKTTIINEQNNVKDMSLVVNDKVAENGDNDIYNVDLKFSLDFALAESDELTITLTGADGKNIKDANGNDIVIEKKLAVKGSEQDNGTALVADDNGVYTLTGLQLSEGTDFNFNLTLDGKQTVEEDVYIYSAYGGTKASQTMVGIASGTQDVNITVESTLSFTVEEEVKHKEERVWHHAFDPVKTPPEQPEQPTWPTWPTWPNNPQPNNPQQPAEPAEPAAWTAPENQRLANDEAVEIPEEPVPLAAPVITGDDTGLWIMALLLIACGMVAVNVFDKKRHHETF